MPVRKRASIRLWARDLALMACGLFYFTGFYALWVSDYGPALLFVALGLFLHLMSRICDEEADYV